MLEAARETIAGFVLELLGAIGRQIQGAVGLAGGVASSSRRREKRRVRLQFMCGCVTAMQRAMNHDACLIHCGEQMTKTSRLATCGRSDRH
jgi:hypothetical protein